MITTLSKRFLPTPGAQSLAMAYAVVMGFGVIFSVMIILHLDNTVFFSRTMTLYEHWILLSGAFGAALGLRFCLPWFGTSSLRLTLGGIGMVTFVAPIIAGTLALPVYGTMFGTFTMGVILLASPITALLWCVTLLCVDRLVRKWLAERDSIFGREQERFLPRWLTGPLERLRGGGAS